MKFESQYAKMWFEEESKTVFLEGTFRLNADEYSAMSDALNEVLVGKPSTLKLDLTGLEFLNSSGINVIAKFVIAVRNLSTVALTVRGCKKIPWQGKSLPNLKKIHPGIALIIE